MPGIVNLPSARVTAAYAVPDGPCAATTRAPSSGAPEESVTTPAIAAVVTPWAPSAGVAPQATVTKSRQILNDRTNVLDRKSTRLNSSHGYISYAVFCLKKKKKTS